MRAMPIQACRRGQDAWWGRAWLGAAQLCIVRCEVRREVLCEVRCSAVLFRKVRYAAKCPKPVDCTEVGLVLVCAGRRLVWF